MGFTVLQKLKNVNVMTSEFIQCVASVYASNFYVHSYLGYKYFNSGWLITKTSYMVNKNWGC